MPRNKNEIKDIGLDKQKLNTPLPTPSRLICAIRAIRG